MNTAPNPSARRLRSALFLPLLLLGLAGGPIGSAQDPPAGEPAEPWISPSALALSADGATLFIASATSGQVLLLDTATRKLLRSLPLPGSPSGLAMSADGNRLLVTCAGPESVLKVLDWREGRELRSIPLGSGALAPVLSPDGRTAFVCNRFDDAISVVDLERGTERQRIEVEREPVAAAITPDGRHLLVGNHLPTGPADAGMVSAHVSVIDTATGKVLRRIPLPNGGNLIRDVRVSPDGRHACVTHILARFQLPTTQVERGWMNSNALTLIDLATLEILNTVLLDQIEQGTANPWAACWTADGRTLLVTHAGTHELSVINVPHLLEKLGRLPQDATGKANAPGYVVSQIAADVPSDLSFLSDLRQLLPLGGNGPRAVVAHGSHAYVGHYFSESLSVVDLGCDPASALEVPLRSPRPMTAERRGEALFNDARLCLENWQSCASCHSAEGRVDALNWDLLNDGKGNAKNTKSLLHAHVTAPAMSLGIRSNAEVAVRAGIHHILFTVQPPEVPAAIDRWLSGLREYPSPHLRQGRPSPAAVRGQALFNSPATGCAECHPAPLYTNRGSYPVGTPATAAPSGDALDTPSLIELWRTAPYLHDGSAGTLREVILQRNVRDQHGRTSHLTAPELDDLVAFLLSL